MLFDKTVPLAQSALLVIDVQDSFKANAARWARRSNPAFEKNVAALIDLYREAGLPVIFFLHTDPDEGFATDSPFFKLMDFVKPRPGEPVLVKNTRNVFTSTTLAERLLELGVRRLVVTGISTEQCCETSTRVAADLGYAVDFVMEATRTFPIPDPDRPGQELGVDEIHQRTEYVLKGRFARMATVSSLQRELKEVATFAAR
jgi:nicotinamidase-related amidase